MRLLIVAVAGCNVGYAFVNFLSPEDVFRFADARLGEKWCVLSSFLS